MTEGDAEALLRLVAAAVFEPTSESPLFPAALRTDTSPRIVFLSLSDGSTAARVVMSAGRGIERTVSQVVTQAQRRLELGWQPKWIKMDLVQAVETLTSADLERPLGFERSLNGLAFERESGIAFLPEELVARTLVNSEGELRRANIDSYLATRATAAGTVRRLGLARRQTLHRFTTTSFFTGGETVLPLFRGHRVFSDVTADELLQSAQQAGQYLVDAVGHDGKFVYTYLPKTDRVPDRYNILRHAGTTYSMLELYEATADSALLQAARRALVYLAASAQPCGIERDLACIVEEGYVKLGGNGLAIVALAKFTEITQDRRYWPLLQQLARWISSVQSGDGRFGVHKQAYPSGEVSDFVSEYYPGEALLAMTRLHALDQDEAWLDTAEKGARYLITVRDAGVPEDRLPHDHWFLYALNDLYRQRPNRPYLEHTARLARAIVAAQNRAPRYADWLGSYYRPPRSGSTATRSEGLCAAYELIRDFGDPQEAETILDAVRLGVRFQLQTQFGPESAMYVADAGRSLGGFHKSLTDYTIRIDYLQHNISSLLCLARIPSSAG